MKNYPIKIETGEHAGETVWVHRSMAVAGFVFCKIGGVWKVLANQRGEGTPDFQGYWNCPCGYLDFDETLIDACIREIYEETGVTVDPDKLTFAAYNDDPKDSNRQNVTMRFISVLDADKDNIGISTSAIQGNLGGEVGEVKAVQWIDVNALDNYQWAFGHDKIIKELHNLVINHEG